MLGALIALAACGSGAPHGPPADEALDTALESGADAIAIEEPGEAARGYANAYRFALQRDDASSLATAGAGEAIALERAGRAAAALDAAARTRVDLARRGASAPAILDLAEAAALLQLGRPADAARVAAPAEQSTDPPARERAVFLEGLAADALSDRATLAEARDRIAAGMGKRPDRTVRADERELSARLALADGHPSAALDAARRAADLRRDALDYRGMRRALRLASRAADGTGDHAAAAALASDAAASAASARPDAGSDGGAVPGGGGTVDGGEATRVSDPHGLDR